ncbi:metallophosphoesterase family protein [Desulfosporosinus hippei]|uniref:DNA repair exonuclease SbcCD nuclease subunit n=1 Tax=Desulfosporosinus hippei DSM 8344 TaxID=1121419 RepID=A0A1G7YPL2_9FIRM|nr:hypothetical protein [Desulfosporosinus hippei]SDG98371.1 DNA repair exonuclease SbcCD nuclease subunit [Desulfosporosinus hippei DSM 8344]
MAASVRFIQCAGFRFDSPAWDGPERWAAARNQDLWQTFQALLSLCQAEKIELLFLTGNLFEQQYVRQETVERVAELLGKLEGTKVFITPGRRDPLTISSAYRLTVWPRNVHIFSSGIKSVKLPSHNLTIYGAGWTAYHQEKSFLDDFTPINDTTLKIMLLHAVVDSQGNSQGLIPIKQDQISASGVNYLALGHLEGWSGIQQAGKTVWADCGVIEARSFVDIGSHGVILGEIREESTCIEFRELGQRCYYEINLTVQSQESLAEIAERIIKELSPDERQKNLYRINISGDKLEIERLVSPLQKLLMAELPFVEVIAHAEPDPSYVDLPRPSKVNIQEGFPTLAQIFSGKLQTRLSEAVESENKEYWGVVQKIGMTALGQGRIVDED